ncbi:MAG: helix-turn-helix domain-containing protein [Candidatus Moranbacteria bacterium]|nr:helix-turn-helix domain-containing protein [Candidatus Moranbacteria bacterium]
MKRNGFTRKKVCTLTMGERLKKSREEAHLEIQDVARAIRIKKEYLEAIEQNKYEKLPADVYAKGFVRSYARYLGHNEETFAKLFDRERNIHRNIKKETTEEKVVYPITLSRFNITPKMLTSGLLFVIVMGSFGYLYKEIDTYISEPLLSVASPQDGMAVDAMTVVVEGETEKNARVFINDQEITINEDGVFSRDVSMQNGANRIVVKARNKFDKETSKTITVQASFVEEEARDISQIDALTQDLNVLVNVVADKEVWIQAEADGTILFSGTLEEGEEREFRAKEKIVINTDAGESLRISEDGEEFQIFSQDGSVATKEYPTKEE